MCALFDRAEAHDFLDVDAAIQSGRYTRARLVDLAAHADQGFNAKAFVEALGVLEQITDADFDFYGVAPTALAGVRERFADWRAELQRQL